MLDLAGGIAVQRPSHAQLLVYLDRIVNGDDVALLDTPVLVEERTNLQETECQYVEQTRVVRIKLSH
jgi:hypothetical protein